MVISPIEAIVFEVFIRKETWFYFCLYIPHYKHKQVCWNTIDALVDACRASRPLNIFLIRDLNIDLLCDKECKWLKDVMDIHGLSNFIVSPTCHKSSYSSLIDALLTSHRRRIANTLNVNTCISNFHYLVACSTKILVPRNGNRYIHYRSYKHFDEKSFKHDLDVAPFNVGDIFDDVDDIFWFNNTMIQDILDGHIFQLKDLVSPLIWKNPNYLRFTNARIVLCTKITILSVCSHPYQKRFEKIYNQQLYEYFKHVLSDLLSAFRKRYARQHVLTKLIEDSKRALDNHMHVGLLLLDLIKAFDCLPHRLLICKLHAYGVSREFCSLVLSYLKDRLQRVKISATKSHWAKWRTEFHKVQFYVLCCLISL